MTQLPDFKLIERHYPFSENELVELAKKNADFSRISFNHEISWTPGLVEKLKNTLDWEIFSANESVDWESIAPAYKHKIYWDNAIRNSSFVWKEDYLPQLKTGDQWHFISIIKLPFTIELIEKYADYWDWNSLSMNDYIPWSDELLSRFKNFWNWGSLSYNSAIPFTPELIENFKSNWNFNLMSMNERLISDEFLPVLKSFTSLNYDLLSYAKKDFTQNFLELHEHKLNWYELSANEYLPWNDELLNRFAHRWQHLEMSGNKNIPWNQRFIELYKDEWNWKGDRQANLAVSYAFSANEGLPWSFELVEKYKERWEWGKIINSPTEDYTIHDGVSGISKLNWTMAEIEEYSQFFDDEFILNNPNFYKAIEKEVGQENIFNFYRSISK